MLLKNTTRLREHPLAGGFNNSFGIRQFPSFVTDVPQQFGYGA